MFFLFKRDEEPEVPPVMRVSARNLHRRQAVGFWGRLWQKMPFVTSYDYPVIRPEGESAEEIWQRIWHTLENFGYRLRSWIPLILLVIAAYVSYGWLQNLEKKSVDNALRQITHHLPDATMTHSVSTFMNAQGKIARQVSALYAQHYPDGHTLLTHPYVVLYANAQPQWYIWAEKGKIAKDNKTYFLLGKTYFKRYNSEGELQLDILSRDVTISPDEGIATTQASTTIITPLGVTDAIGIQVWMNERRVKLNQQVRGRYVFKQKD